MNVTPSRHRPELDKLTPFSDISITAERVFRCGGFDSHRLCTVARFDSLQASGVLVAQPKEVTV